MKEIALSVLSLIISLLFVILFIALGWFIVWKLFLSRFKFVRELLGTNGSESAKEEEKVRKTRTKVRRD
ncbi:Small integral membrane protein 13 [Mizuhopecten yessoensis]|uniref:Small integral membrane protein 13 n=1 Tax=Mizuhopecten yessoensis TaxID=6573 RepID=A0A210PNF0_MIZYE|nr:Small integral membrane protein 13 [Mizuhopecten yessoensis]